MSGAFQPTQFMLILPEKGLSLSTEQATALASALLNIAPSSNSAWISLARSISAAIAVHPYNNLSRMIPSERRRQDFEIALPMLTELIQRLAVARPELALKGFRLYPSVQDLPSSLSSSRGVFQPGIAYAVHPADPDYFIAVADFHSYLLHDKRAEFLRLAAALGAKEVRQLQRESAVKSSHAHTKLDVPANGVLKAEGTVATSRNESSYFSMNASFGQTHQRPRLPEDLRWYHQEPLWKAMAETRLKHNAISFELTFRYQQDFHVDAILVAEVQALGLSVGGSFETMNAIEQECTVEFYPMTPAISLDPMEA